MLAEGVLSVNGYWCRLMPELQIGVKVRFFNWRLDQSIRAKGWTRQQAADACGVHLSLMYKYLSFKNYPNQERRFAFAIALAVPDEELFPIGIEGFRLEKQPESFPITKDQIAVQDAGGHILDKLILKEVLFTLPIREQYVLERAFGLNGHPSLMMKELAEDLGVTRSRVQQLKESAFKRLRHPCRIRILEEVLVNA